MKTRHHILITSTLLAHCAQSATITATGRDDITGIVGYTYQVALSAADDDTSSFAGSIGKWSWNDPSVGESHLWRHQADWIAVSLTEATKLDVQVRRNDSVDDIELIPSFTIYKNFNDTAEGGHGAHNTSDIQWDPANSSQILEYVDHMDNTTLGEISKTMMLPAGDYSIVMGGNRGATQGNDPVNYFMTLNAAPIPEASSALLGVLASTMLLARRKRLKA